jgi:hypothetical protein
MSLIIYQRFKEYINYRDHKFPPLDTILSQLGPVYSLVRYFFYVHIYYILSVKLFLNFMFSY